MTRTPTSLQDFYIAPRTLEILQNNPGSKKKKKSRF